MPELAPLQALAESGVIRIAQEANDRAARLQAAGDALTESRTEEEMARALVDHAVTAMGATAGFLARLTEDGTELEVLGSVGYSRPSDNARPRLSIQGASLPAEVARTGHALFVISPDSSDATSAPTSGNGSSNGATAPSADPYLATDNGFHAAAGVALTVRSRPVAVLVLSFGGDRTFTDQDKAFLHILSARASEALVRFLLREAEQRDREVGEWATQWTAGLERVSAALMEAATEAGLAEVAAARAREALDAGEVAVFRLNEQQSELVLAASAGRREDPAAAFLRIPLTARLPESDAARTGAPMVIDSAEAMVGRYPHLQNVWSRTQYNTFIAVPIKTAANLLGIITCKFPEAEASTADRLAFIRALAQQMVRGLDRIRLQETRQATRTEADAVQNRLAFLVSASEELALAGDAPSALARLAHVAVPALADWCWVFVDREGDEPLAEVAVANPGKASVLADLLRYYPPRSAAPTPIGEALRTGRPVLLASVSDMLLRSMATDARHLRLMRRLQPRSMIIAPMVSRGRVLGAVGMAMAESGRTYLPMDLILAEDLARRAALALEGARLLDRERDVAETIEQTMAPSRLPELPGLAVAARYIAAARPEPGDWYDVFTLPDGRIAMVLGTAARLGVEAGIAVPEVRAMVRAHALQGLSPRQTLERLDGFAGQGPTVLYLTFDPTTNEARFAARGPSRVLRIDLDGTGTYLGGGPARNGSVPMEESRAALAPGQTLLLHTDTLCQKAETPQAGLVRVKTAALGGGAGDLEALLDAVARGTLDGERPEDRVALLALRPMPLDPEHFRVRLPAVPSCLGLFRRLLQGWLARSGSSADESFEILIACGEACANAITHAYQGGEGDIELEAGRRFDDLTMTVRDWGQWRGGPAARGFHMMRTYMDAVEVETSDGETRIVMHRRGSRRIDA